MNLFYCPEITPITTGTDAIHFTLSEEESFHATRVLRMKKGNKIFLTDGRGMFYEGEIVSVGKHSKPGVEVKIISTEEDKAKRNFHLTIAIAPTKNMDRFEWFLEKATEIGCDEIIPIACRHSERTVVKAERLNKVIVSAMKQCLKSQLPHLHECIEFKKFITSPLASPKRFILRMASEKDFAKASPSPLHLERGVEERGEEMRQQKFIGHIPELSESEFPPKHPQGKLLSTLLIPRADSRIIIAIGPEGGFSEEEVSLAMQNDFTAMSLGNSRLRVETAGVVACSVVNMVNSG